MLIAAFQINIGRSHFVHTFSLNRSVRYARVKPYVQDIFTVTESFRTKFVFVLWVTMFQFVFFIS